MGTFHSVNSSKGTGKVVLEKESEEQNIKNTFLALTVLKSHKIY